MALGEARVEIKPDLSAFDAQLRKGVTDALGKIQTAADKTGEAIEDSFAEAGDAVKKELDGMYRDANGRLRDIEGKFVAMSSLSREAVEAISKGDAFAGLERDAEKASSKIKREMKDAADDSARALDGIGSGFGKIAAGLGGVLAGVGLGSFLADATMEAQAANSALANTAQLIESTGGKAGVTQEQITALADSMRFSIGIDDTAVVEASNALLTFTGVSGPIFDETIMRAADLSAVLGTDLQGATMQLGKALNDPLKGMSALSRSGVSFTAEQKAQVAAMVEVGDTAGAQRLILDELATQFGGTAVASADSTARIAANFGELKEAIGAGLIGALDQVTPSLLGIADSLMGPMALVGEAMGEFAGPLLEAFGPSVTILVNQFAFVLQDIGAVLSSLAPLISPLVQFFGMLATTISGALASAFTALAPSIELIAEYIDVFADQLGEKLWEAIELLIPALIEIVEAFVPLLPLILDVALAALPPLIRALDIALPAIVAISDILAAGLAAVLVVVAGNMDILAPIILTIVGAMKLASIVTGIWSAAVAALNAIMAANPIGLIALAIAALAAAIVAAYFKFEAFREIVDSIWQGMQVVWDWVTANFITLWGYVSDAAIAAFEFILPYLQTLGDFFVDTWELMKAGFDAVWPPLKEAFSAAVQFLTDAFNTWIDLVKAGWEIILAVAGPIIDGLKIAFDLAFKAMKVYFDVFKRAIEIGWNALQIAAGVVIGGIQIAWEVMSAVVGPLFDGLKIAADVAFTAIGTVVETVTTAIELAFGGVKTVLGGIFDGIKLAFKTMANGIANIWNSTVGKLSFKIPDWVPMVGGKSFDVPDMPTFADGTIAYGPTMGIFGEAGAEAVIPITRPRRALELMEQSGLADLARSTTSGGTALVNIQSAVFATPSDADLVAQRVLAAQRSRSFAA